MPLQRKQSKASFHISGEEAILGIIIPFLDGKARFFSENLLYPSSLKVDPSVKPGFLNAGFKLTKAAAKSKSLGDLNVVGLAEAPEYVLEEVQINQFIKENYIPLQDIMNEIAPKMEDISIEWNKTGEISLPEDPSEDQLKNLSKTVLTISFVPVIKKPGKPAELSENMAQTEEGPKVNGEEKNNLILEKVEV